MARYDEADVLAALAFDDFSRGALETIGGASYVLEANGAKTGPVCPACYADGITVMLESAAKGGAQCSKCGARYAGVRASVEGPRMRVG